MKTKFSIAIFILVCSAAVLSCGADGEPSKESAAEKEPVVPLPKVTDERDDLILSWYVNGEAITGSMVSEVPDEVKKEVRVQDPTIPPEARNPDIVYLADLTRKSKDGYLVKAVPRASFEAARIQEKEKAAKAAAEALAAAGDAPQGDLPEITLPDGTPPRVIMYATKHCPVCVKARRWLLEQRIPYVEKDLETDQAAAAEVQKKGAAQGVSTNGVPIFEINGRLLPGFDPAQIVALLVKGSGAQKTI